MHVGAHHAPQLLVAPLGDEVHVELTERGEEAVGVVGGDDAAAVGHVEPVVGHLLDGEYADPHAAVLVPEGDARAIVEDDDDRLGHGAQDAHGDTVLARMRAEDCVRVVMGTIDDEVELGPIDLDGARQFARVLLARAFLARAILTHGACSIDTMCAMTSAGSKRT